MGKYIELKAEYVREEVEGSIRISRRKVSGKRNVTVLSIVLVRLSSLTSLLTEIPPEHSLGFHLTIAYSTYLNRYYICKGLLII